MRKLKKQGLPENKILPALIDSVLHLLFPDRCLFCRDILPLPDSLPLCSDCRTKHAPSGRICPGCERLWQGNSPTCGCQPNLKSLQSLYALSSYDQRWRQLLHDLKYRKRRSLGRPLGMWLAREIIAQNYCLPAVVVPVPLHRHKEKERGFNQSALIAEHAARFLKVPCRCLLTKNMDTISQTTISRRERYKNVSGVFSCTSALASGSVVLLVDDIYSTGATMKEAASVLQDNGALVYGAVISYNPRIY